jgi:hypothetical protein
MMTALCHCHAVRIELDGPPPWILDCNCSLCRRYGALWAYHNSAPFRIVSDPSATLVYRWGGKGLAFHHCRTCGCTTHIAVPDAQPRPLWCMNARLIIGLDSATPLRQSDNAHTGVFWTRSSEPIRPGGQPKMDDPEKWL